MGGKSPSKTNSDFRNRVAGSACVWLWIASFGHQVSGSRSATPSEPIGDSVQHASRHQRRQRPVAVFAAAAPSPGGRWISRGAASAWLLGKRNLAAEEVGNGAGLRFYGGHPAWAANTWPPCSRLHELRPRRSRSRNKIINIKP